MLKIKKGTMKQYLLLVLASLIISCNIGQPDLSKGMQSINSEDMARYVENISADSLLGRKPGTAAEQIAIDYLAKEFERIGLKPANRDNWFQEVPLVSVTGKPSNMKIKLGEKSLNLAYRTDFVAFSRRIKKEITLNESGLVFAGFGIDAPEFGKNDFEGLDLKGKTVLIFVNDPGFGAADTTYFKGNSMTYYGRWTYKYEEAARKGAEAVFIIHESEQAGYPYSVVLNGAIIPKLYLQPDDGYKNRCAVEGWFTYSAADSLLNLLGYKITELKELAKKPDFKPFELNASLNLNIQQSFEYSVSNNVIGMIEGSKFKDECIIYSAHWDHLGVGNVLDGDSIYNGAVDNGTALAWMLEIAEAFMKMDTKPERSILFMAPTAEEQGLLGAEYYVNNALLPIEKTVANINNDLMLPLGKWNDVMITGYNQSELEDMTAEIAKRQGRYLVPDPNPQTGMFYRADHFPFAKAGVPSLFARGNVDLVVGGKALAAAKE
ncbi:MAG TPA: peptidase M28, partial [Bacteroidales bacterium]|nr:peptidase M28 [Bacteroidales bacterium]